MIEYRQEIWQMCYDDLYFNGDVILTYEPAFHQKEVTASFGRMEAQSLISLYNI